MNETLSISRPLEMLDAAKRRRNDAAEQFLLATHEVLQCEVNLRNAKRDVTDLRPLENAGDFNCTPHKWRSDPKNGQMYCQCGARYDLVIDDCNLGELMEADAMQKIVLPDLSINKETASFMARAFGIEGAGPPPSPSEVAFVKARAKARIVARDGGLAGTEIIFDQIVNQRWNIASDSAEEGDDWYAEMRKSIESAVADGKCNCLSSPFPGMGKPWTQEMKDGLKAALKRYPPHEGVVESSKVSEGLAGNGVIPPEQWEKTHFPHVD